MFSNIQQYKSFKAKTIEYINLFNYMDVFLFTNVFQDFRPDSRTDFAYMGFLQQKHKGSRLSYPPAYTKWNLVIDDGLMIGKMEQILLA